jgi:hypothetical protein
LNSANRIRKGMSIRCGFWARTDRPRSVILKRPLPVASSSMAARRYEVDQATRFEKVA